MRNATCVTTTWCMHSCTLCNFPLFWVLVRCVNVEVRQQCCHPCAELETFLTVFFCVVCWSQQWVYYAFSCCHEFADYVCLHVQGALYLGQPIFLLITELCTMCCPWYPRYTAKLCNAVSDSGLFVVSWHPILNLSQGLYSTSTSTSKFHIQGITLGILWWMELSVLA